MWQKQSDDQTRSCAYILSHMWLYSNASIEWVGRQSIVRVDCPQISYDHGWSQSTGSSRLWNWKLTIKKNIKSGDQKQIARAFTIRESYTGMLDYFLTGYLHKINRYNILVKVIRATFNNMGDWWTQNWLSQGRQGQFFVFIAFRSISGGRLMAVLRYL